MANQILLVDDDALLRRSLAFSLEQAGYRVSTAATAEDALSLAQRETPDLFLLDIGLPGIDGLEALKTIQREFDVPVIFLTARRRELDEIVGLELGASDYITKPFNTDVLLARIKVALRHIASEQHAEEDILTVGDLVIDPAAHVVTLDDREIDLPPREFDLLHALALDAGRVVSIDDLLARVWGAEFLGEPQVVYVHIRWLREILEDDPQTPHRIVTVRGVGYKLEPQ
jgi:DNA-binding response OmpR family regulator